MVKFFDIGILLIEFKFSGNNSQSPSLCFSEGVGQRTIHPRPNPCLEGNTKFLKSIFGKLPRLVFFYASQLSVRGIAMTKNDMPYLVAEDSEAKIPKRTWDNDVAAVIHSLAVTTIDFLNYLDVVFGQKSRSKRLEIHNDLSPYVKELIIV